MTSNTRLEVFLEAQKRLDYQGRNTRSYTGKTRKGSLNCSPGNVQCGGRCIPRTWDCRLAGQGTNSELSTHSHDLLGGAASIQRGAVNLRKGLLQANPELVQRGKSSIIRGVVKVTPGDELEKKKQLKKDLERKTRVISTALAVTVLGTALYRGGRKNPFLKRTVTDKIDKAAATAVDSVLDRMPVVGARRAAQRGAGVAAVERMTEVGLRRQGLENIARQMPVTNPAKPGPASVLGRIADINNSGIDGKYNEYVRNNKNVDYDVWRQEGSSILYGGTIQKGRGAGDSVFSTDAAGYLLTKEHRLNPTGVIGPQARLATRESRRAALVNNLTTKYTDVKKAMDTEMRINRMTPKQYENVIASRVRAGVGGFNAEPGARTQVRDKTIARLNSLVKADTDAKIRAIATQEVRETESMFNIVFNDLSSNLKRNAASSDSPQSQASIGFASYLAKRSSSANPTKIAGTKHADLYLRFQHFNKVNGQTGNQFITANDAILAAKEIVGPQAGKGMTGDKAIDILRTQGGLQITSTRVALATGQTSRTSARRGGKTLAQRAAEIQLKARREGKKMTLKAATEQARRERKDHDDTPIRLQSYLVVRAVTN